MGRALLDLSCVSQKKKEGEQNSVVTRPKKERTTPKRNPDILFFKTCPGAKIQNVKQKNKTPLKNNKPQQDKNTKIRSRKSIPRSDPKKKNYTKKTAKGANQFAKKKKKNSTPLNRGRANEILRDSTVRLHQKHL